MSNNAPQLLIVDDDIELLDLLAHYLAKENFKVMTAKSGEMVNRILADHKINLVILDLMLPGEDGLSICRRIRVNSAIPIIILTAKGNEIDRIIGLEMGADDYVTKPFNPRELVARIKAVLWRAASNYEDVQKPRPDDTLTFSGWRINFFLREVTSCDGTNIQLSSGEFDLLRVFVKNPGKPLTRDQLLDLTKGRALVPYDRSIDIYVSRLRRKIETDPQHPLIIQTVRGVGYKFNASVTVA